VSLRETNYHSDRDTKGHTHGDTISSLEQLATAYHAAGRSERGVALLEASVEQLLRVREKGDPVCVRHRAALGSALCDAGRHSEACHLFEDLYKLARSSPGVEVGMVLYLQQQAAILAFRVEEPAEALTRLRECQAEFAKQYGPRHEQCLGIRLRLAQHQCRLGFGKEALAESDSVLELARADLPPAHPVTVHARLARTEALIQLDELDKALGEAEGLFRVAAKELGDTHDSTLNAMTFMAKIHYLSNRLHEARAGYELVLERRRKRPNGGDTGTLDELNGLAACYHALGEPKRAIPLLEQDLKLRSIQLGPNHATTWTALNNLAQAQKKIGDPASAAKTLEDLHARMLKKQGPDDPKVSQLAFELVSLLRDQMRDAERALPYSRAGAESRVRTLKPDDRFRIDSQNHLGWTLALAGQLDEAEKWLRKSEESAAAVPDFPKEWRQVYAFRLFWVYTDLGKPDDARKWSDTWAAFGGRVEDLNSDGGDEMFKWKRYAAAEVALGHAFELRTKGRDPSWKPQRCQAMLAVCQARLKKYADAEKNARAIYEAFWPKREEREYQAWVTLLFAFDALVATAEATNNPDDLRKWKTEQDIVLKLGPK
jgi:eukaryotic-like serine/threonine-protein kinase